MRNRLPRRLEREPLVEAVCQLRVVVKVPLNAFFPGTLLAKHAADVSEIQQLPAAMVPEQMRNLQPELAFVPLVQLRFRGLLVMIGERSVTVSNPAPYLGWAAFRPIITEVFNELFESKQILMVERYSIKYTNVLKTNERPDPLQALRWGITVGDLAIEHQRTTLQTEALSDDGLTTVITLCGGVTVQAAGQPPVQGALIDVDTICQQAPLDSMAFVANMAERLDRVRSVNKQAFFECLTDEAINALEPVYD